LFNHLNQTLLQQSAVSSTSDIDADIDKAFEDTEAQETKKLEIKMKDIPPPKTPQPAPSESDVTEYYETASVASDTGSVKRKRGRPSLKTKIRKAAPRGRVSLTLARRKVSVA
jgi:hypothetical protein